MSESINREGLAQQEHIQESALTQEMQDFIMNKLGLKLEEFASAQTNPSFSVDLQNLMNNPENNTERTVFLGKYIYDQIIAEAQQSGEDPMKVAKMKRDIGEWNIKQFLEFGKYNRSIQEQTVIEINTKNQDDEKAQTNELANVKKSATEKQDSDKEMQDRREKHIQTEQRIAEYTQKAI